MAVEVINGLTPREEREIPMLVLNLRNPAAFTLTGGSYRNAVYELAKIAETLEKSGVSLPWIRGLLKGAGADEIMAATLLGTLASIIVGHGLPGTRVSPERGDDVQVPLLMPFGVYAWYDLMRTVYNPLYIRGERFHGYAGAVDLLKRLDFLVSGWSTLTPGLLDWTAILRRTASLLVREVLIDEVRAREPSLRGRPPLDRSLRQGQGGSRKPELTEEPGAPTAREERGRTARREGQALLLLRGLR